MLQFMRIFRYIIKYGGDYYMQKGLYFAYNEEEAFGISFACVYITKEKEFQISLMLGYLALAIGYKF